MFERRSNFDLRRLLDGTKRGVARIIVFLTCLLECLGTEGFLFSLISKLEQDFGLVTGSLAAVRLDPTLRLKAGDLLVPPKDYKVSLSYPQLFQANIKRYRLKGRVIRSVTVSRSIPTCHYPHSTEEAVDPSFRSPHSPQHPLLEFLIGKLSGIVFGVVAYLFTQV